MSRYIVSSDELLILRDGRPFGDSGTFGGTALDWPLPQTLAGMCRTAIGHARDVDTFKNPDAIKALLDLGLEKILPCLVPTNRHENVADVEMLLPMPGDLVIMEGEHEKNRVYPLYYDSLNKEEGTDLKAEEWLYPFLALKGKPLASPRFLRRELAWAYLEGAIADSGCDVDMDTETIAGPVRDFRVHVALEPQTFTAAEGRLYGESGIYLKAVKAAEDGIKGHPLPGQSRTGPLIGDIGIGFNLTGLEKEEKMPTSLYLGGERRRADLFPAEDFSFPPPPENFENQRFLKMLLITHGDFGGWAPQWLLPETDGGVCWVRVPESGAEIRLRSAVINGWDPVSGWDMEQKKPKATRKLVRPGAVYLIELKKPSESASLVRALWGKSLCSPGSREANDGFGQIMLAKTHTITNGKDMQ